MEIKFHVPAVPVAQQRPRAVNAGKHARMADVPQSHPIHAFKATIRMAWRGHWGDRPPLQGGIRLLCRFLMPRTNAMLSWKRKRMVRVPYTGGRNDWDNLGKGVSDALQGLAYLNDGQIWDVHVERWYASGYEAPHVELELETRPEWDQYDFWLGAAEAAAAEAAGGDHV